MVGGILSVTVLQQATTATPVGRRRSRMLIITSTLTALILGLLVG